MNLKLDPPSGFADSYFDIEFLVTFTKSPKSIITLHNDTSNEHLDIVGVASGYILSGKSAIIKESSQLRGHFNLFNDDKMNRKFSLYSSAKLRCRVEHFDEDDNSIGMEEEILVFYNESHSLDAEIIPFDIVVHNKEINLEDNEPLKIDLISGLPKNYVISVKSADDKVQCNLEISANMGRTTIEIPASMLAYDLDLKAHGRKTFDIYYIKNQGTSLSRLANRKFYKIDNTQLTFKGDNIGLAPQSRIDPCSRKYSKNFVISDRYLVLCPAEFSGFSKKSEFSPEKNMDLTMLLHEGQHMENLVKEMQQFSAGATQDSDNISKTQKSIQHGKHKKAHKIRPRINSDQIQLMKSVSGAYESVVSRPKRDTTSTQPKPQKVAAFSAARQQSNKPCAPCARKRNKNA